MFVQLNYNFLFVSLDEITKDAYNKSNRHHILLKSELKDNKNIWTKKMYYYNMNMASLFDIHT